MRFSTICSGSTARGGGQTGTRRCWPTWAVLRQGLPVVFIGGMFLWLIGSATAGEAEEAQFRKIRAELYRAMDQWHGPNMKAAIANLEKLIGQTDKPWWVRYYMALGNYHLSLLYLARENKEKGEPFLDRAIEQITAAVKAQENEAELHILLAACYEMKIAYLPTRAITLSPLVTGALEQARLLTPENPRIFLIEGIHAFHVPENLGGGMTRAREALSRAAEQFSHYRPSSAWHPDWGEDLAYIYLGRIAMREGNLDRAETYFHRALELKPEHPWVMTRLLPQLEKNRAKTSSGKQ